jgi:hypothetical protein
MGGGGGGGAGLITLVEYRKTTSTSKTLSIGWGRGELWGRLGIISHSSHDIVQAYSKEGGGWYNTMQHLQNPKYRKSTGET